tara:strand:+ start:938 stop:1882 length:945 start_codon:yes stop_codon:yes gene_type:complete
MINWGILGLGRMGMAFANAIEETDNSKLIAIASKSGKKFKNFENLSYEDLIKKNDIDAIYIASLNNTHTELIKQISKEGKKILCEKPVSLSLGDLIEIEQLLNKENIKFYEAIAYYSHPQTVEIINILKKNNMGEIKRIESNFGFKAKFKSDSRLFNKSLGGGSIYDLGCYPISFFMLFAQNYKKISIKSKSLNYAESGVDDEANLILNYDNKFEGVLNVSLKANLNNICKIYCENGYIKINEPWLPGQKTNIEVLVNDHFFIRTVNSNLSIYANQIQNVSESFINNNNKKNLFDINKSISNMKLIENWLKKEK